MAAISSSDVLATIEKALGMKPGSLNETTDAKQVPNWDSLGQLSILVALDKLFSGKMAAITEMGSADSVPKIMGLLKKHSLV
jgi:acyl carrier protein